ncbi:hypothetical protein JXJ21_04360 [candidate division KSB1 bacterium]|nr:hypothetical protein [candidate division KSB1 bacterium]
MKKALQKALVIGLVFACCVMIKKMQPKCLNFTNTEIHIDKKQIPPDVTLVFFDSDSLLMNGFFSSLCTVITARDTLELEDAICINLKLALENEISVNQILHHELIHFEQRQRYADSNAYLAELNRQRCLPYWQRPWEIEAIKRQENPTKLVTLGRPKPATSIKVQLPFYTCIMVE